MFVGGVGFLRTLGVGFFYPTPEVQLNHYLNHTPKLGISVEIVQFLYETFIETENSCCASRFLLIAGCYNIVDNQTSFTLC